MIRLVGDEQIVLVERRTLRTGAWLLALLTLGVGLYFWRRKVFVVTDRRVLIKSGIIKITEQSVPLSRVQDAVLSLKWFTGDVALSAAGGPLGLERIGPLTRAGARRFAHVVLAQAHGTGQQSSP